MLAVDVYQTKCDFKATMQSMLLGISETPNNDDAVELLMIPSFYPAVGG